MNYIEIITFDGCQNAQDLITELRNHRTYDKDFSLKVSIVASADLSEELGLHGSPTILINGEEYQGELKGNAGFY